MTVHEVSGFSRYEAEPLLGGLENNDHVCSIVEYVDVQSTFSRELPQTKISLDEFLQ